MRFLRNVDLAALSVLSCLLGAPASAQTGEYCRFVGDFPNVHLSCGLVRGNSIGNNDVNALGYEQGYMYPGDNNLPRFMADVNGDGKADFCRFISSATPHLAFGCAFQTGTGWVISLPNWGWDLNSAPGFDPGYANMPRFMADVNGDGRADYCRFVGDPPNVHLSCALAGANRFGNNDVNAKPWGAPGGIYAGDDNMPKFMADVNGDGRADYCRFVSSGTPRLTLACALQTGDGFGTSLAGYDLNSAPGFDPGYADWPRFMADVNGDGRADYCRFVGDPPNIHLSCALAGANGFGNNDVNALSFGQGGLDPGYADRPRFMVDVNGDGRADYCRFVGSGSNIFLSCALSTGTGFGQYDVNSAQGYDIGRADMGQFLLSIR